MEPEENWDDVDANAAEPVEIVEVVKGYSTFDSFVKVRFLSKTNIFLVHMFLLLLKYYFF